MARKKGRRKGVRRSKTIPLGMALPVVYTAYGAYTKAGGFNMELPQVLMSRFTGYYPGTQDWNFDRVKPFLVGEIVGIVAGKAATKLGVNRMIKKATMGWFKI